MASRAWSPAGLGGRLVLRVSAILRGVTGPRRGSHCKNQERPQRGPVTHERKEGPRRMREKLPEGMSERETQTSDVRDVTGPGCTRRHRGPAERSGRPVLVTRSQDEPAGAGEGQGDRAERGQRTVGGCGVTGGFSPFSGLRTSLASMRMQDQSLASLRGLRIQGCCGCGGGRRCSSFVTSGLGTSICRRCGPKMKKKKKKKKCRMLAKRDSAIHFLTIP